VVVAVNKVDLKNQAKQKEKPLYEQYRCGYQALFDGYEAVKTLSVSAKTGRNLPDLVTMLLRKLPEAPAYYPEDAVTDQRIREIAAEMIREQVLHHTKEEIPHSVAVGIDRFEENQSDANGKAMTKIYSTLYVDQTSQKGMVIGKAGAMIKRIGMAARKDIEELIEGSVYLELNVKVKKNWRKDPVFLKALGLALPDTAG
nr:GTPase Era [Vampirovibrio sp.]